MNEKDAIYGFIMYVSSKYVCGMDNSDLLAAAREYILMTSTPDNYKEQGEDNV